MINPKRVIRKNIVPKVSNIMYMSKLQNRRLRRKHPF